nr:glycosyltransferase family 2 protein [Eubacterium sp.]
MKEKSTKELLIIIPAYNEEKNIEKLLDQLESPEIAAIADVLIMNDASSDATNWIVKGRKYEIVTHVFNLGYGSALQLGYKYAIRRGYEYVIQMDADGQHDVCNIPVIYKALKTKDENGKCPDIVLGSRFMEGSTEFPVSFAKKLAWSLFRGMIYMGTKRRIADPTTGLQGLSRRVVIFYSQYNHFDDKYPDANIIMQMLLLGFRLVEVPAVMHQRTEGVSMHSGLKPILYMFRMVFSIIAVWIGIRGFKLDAGAADESE